MPGIDKRRIVGKEEDELDELTCGICQDIFDEPVVTQCCRQTYCKSCITQWLSNKTTCPNDRQELDVSRLSKPPRLVLNLVNKLSLKCENYLKGCQTILVFEQMKEHMKICNTCISCEKSKKVIKEKDKEIEELKTKLNEKEIELTQIRKSISLKKLSDNTKTEKIGSKPDSKSDSENESQNRRSRDGYQRQGGGSKRYGSVDKRYGFGDKNNRSLSRNRGQICYNNGQEDHISRDCNQPRKERTKTCFNCNQVGHISVDCPYERRKRQSNYGQGVSTSYSATVYLYTLKTVNSPCII